MNTLSFSSLSAAVLLASVSGLCLAQADMAVTATAAAQNANVAVSMQQQSTIQPSIANATVSANSDSSVSATARAQSSSSQNSAEQHQEESLQNAASQTVLTGGMVTELSQSVVEQPAAALTQSTNITQQSSAVVSALLTPPAVTMPELPSADSVVPAELPALSDVANKSAQAAISQSSSTLVQQQINTELTKAVDDTIKAEVVNSVQSSLTSALNLVL
ncbi:hypothetical protein [Rheinheimera soli]|uniref:Cell wall anchor protein n=1 Tax=Rheinheimera soli TaxID=443616 RepID=A0ABU1VWH2_9GAMM|nr:hypothetical protein [Rheinheimera soli]MDR7120079.1 hypothetical protein [Rheinheimera soli]